eukprot:1553802-Heterocapsa_arctica.AAC.1
MHPGYSLIIGIDANAVVKGFQRERQFVGPWTVGVEDQRGADFRHWVIEQRICLTSTSFQKIPAKLQ